jgi:uncharacterized protein YjbJ (UPF0337 family)
MIARTKLVSAGPVSIKGTSRHYAGLLSFRKEPSMGSTSDKATGVGNEVVGKVKQGVGKAVGSDKLQAEGKVQELKGKTQKVVGDVKAAVKDGAESAADEAHNKLG